jgi:hypothetical protein
VTRAVEEIDDRGDELGVGVSTDEFNAPSPSELAPPFRACFLRVGSARLLRARIASGSSATDEYSDLKRKLDVGSRRHSSTNILGLFFPGWKDK